MKQCPALMRINMHETIITSGACWVRFAAEYTHACRFSALECETIHCKIVAERRTIKRGQPSFFMRGFQQPRQLFFHLHVRNEAFFLCPRLAHHCIKSVASAQTTILLRQTSNLFSLDFNLNFILHHTPLR